MQDAILVHKDGAREKILATAFSKKSDEDIAVMRKSLYCTKCNKQISYRKASTDGKVACFKQYSKLLKHVEGCGNEPVRTVLDKKTAKIVEHATMVLKTSDKPVLLKFTGLLEPSLNKHKGVNDIDDTLDEKDKIPHSPVKKRHDLGPAKIIQKTMQLNVLLNYIIHKDEGDLSHLIEVVYNGEIKQKSINDITCKFEDAINDGEFRLYWGKIKNTVYIKHDKDNNSLYINTEDNLSIILKNKATDSFVRYKKHEIVMPRDAFYDAHVIVYGRCYFGKEGTRHIDVTDSNLISTKIYKPKKAVEHTFTILNAFEKETKNGDDYVSLELRLKLYDSINIDFKCNFNLGMAKDNKLFISLLSSINNKSDEEVQMDELIGKTGSAILAKKYSKYHDENYNRPYLFHPVKFI